MQENNKNSLFFQLMFLAFLLANSWGVAHAVYYAFEFPVLFSWCIGIGILVAATFALQIYHWSKQPGFVPRRVQKRIWGMCGFLLLWSLILLANSHNAYYYAQARSLRNADFQALSTIFADVDKKIVTLINSASSDLNAKGSSLIKNYQSEVTNSQNPGRARFADKILRDFEELVGRDISELSLRTTNPQALRSHADDMGRLMYIVLNDKISEINGLGVTIKNYFSEKNIKSKAEQLSKIRSSSPIDDNAVSMLEDGYADYNKIKAYLTPYFTTPALAPYSTNFEQMFSLPEKPFSEAVRKIDYFYNMVFTGDSRTNWINLFWSVLISLVLDIGCFIFWYFGVNRDQKE